MKNFVIINGVNSNTINGLGINELPPISKPSMRVLTEEIDGRDGDITTPLGYSAYDKTFTIGLFGTGYDINDIISFFNDSGTIVFSNEPDKYYNYKTIAQIDYESLLKFKSASITIHCQPFKYPLEEEPLEIEYEYVNGEGESITLNNTEEDVKMSIQPKGNTSQYSTTGKNLGNSQGLTTQTINDVVFTPVYDNNGLLEYINVNGTASALTNYQFTNLASYNADTYIISGEVNTVHTMLVSQGGSILGEATGNEVTFTTTGTQNAKIWLRVYSGTTVNNAKVYPMIRLSSTSSGYEPYTNGASPNPDYPQPIHSVSGDNVIKGCNKNLIGQENISPLSNATGTITGTTLSFVSTGTYKKVQWYIPIKAGEKFTFSCGGNDTLYLGIFEFSAISESASDRLRAIEWDSVLTNGKTSTFTTQNDGYLRVYIGSSTATTQTLTNLQLERGETKTTAVEHKEDTYEINLGDIKMRGIGTYEDYFVRNSGKNLLNNNDLVLFNSNKYISTPNYSTIGTIKVEPNTTYSFITDKNILLPDNNIYEFDINNENKITATKSATNNDYYTIISFTTSATTHYISFYRGNGNGTAYNSVSDMVKAVKMMFIKGNDYSLPYEPFGSGKWCKYNAIEEVTLASSQFNEKGTTGTNAYYISTTIANGLNDNSVASSMSNKFGMVAFNNRQNGLDVTYVQNGRIYIRTKNNTSLDWSTNQNCKDWLDANSPIIDYILASPYLSLIESETLISQLDNIQNAMSYEGQTNILQNNNDLPFYLIASAMKQNSNEVIVNNIGNIYAKPTLDIEGSGIINIYKDNNQILQLNMDDTNEIVFEDMNAFDPATNELKNRKVTGNYNNVTIPSGESIIKADGNLTKMTITNYTRWL